MNIKEQPNVLSAYQIETNYCPRTRSNKFVLIKLSWKSRVSQYCDLWLFTLEYVHISREYVKHPNK